MNRHGLSRARHGTLLVVVLGLITIFLALMLAITVRVYNTTKSGTTLQLNVQAYLMMQSAKLLIAGSSGTIPGGAVTAGDGDGSAHTPLAIPNRPYGGELGWVHIRGTSPNYDVIAAGGSGGLPFPAAAPTISPRDAATPNALTAGDPIRNAYEIRYYYKLVFTAPGTFAVTLQPVGNYSSVW